MDDLSLKFPTCGAPSVVTVRPTTAIARGVLHQVPPPPVLTPDEDGAVRASDGTVLAYVIAESGSERAAP